MKRRALLGLLVTSACHTSEPAPPPLTRALLSDAHSFGAASESDVRASLSELSHLAEMARDAVRAARSPVAAVTELLFQRLGFRREVEDSSLEFVWLPSVLRTRRGSCVGLGTMFLALAEALHWRAAGVLMPGHFYVRVQAPGGRRNVELLRAGEAMPDTWYARRFPIPGGAAPEYARSLSGAEVVGVVDYNLGNARRRAGCLEPARAAFERATAAFPDFAEAHASLGAVLQLLGRLEPARASYLAALSRNPQLPGLRQNLALLERERAPTP